MITTALGFDFGTRRIGVAVGNTITGNARPLETIHHYGTPDWAGIANLIGQWRPEILIVGMPLQKDGSQQEMTRHAREFMQVLTQRFDLPVESIDERFSSIEAQQRLRQQRANGTRKQRVRTGDTDAVAAQVILENWLAQHDVPA